MAPLLALALLLGPPPTPTPEFEELVHKSMTDYNLGYFDAALREAEQAYRIDPRPALLFNLGQCHRAAGHWERAEFFYRTYLRNLPTARNKALVLELIDKMVTKEKEEPAATATATPEAPAPAVVVVEAATPAPVAPTPAPPAAVAEAHQDEAAPRPHRSRVLPWVLGAGAVVFAGGAVWGWYEAATFASYKAQAHPLPQLQGQATLATAGEVVGIAGAVVAAALATGVVLTW